MIVLQLDTSYRKSQAGVEDEYIHQRIAGIVQVSACHVAVAHRSCLIQKVLAYKHTVVIRGNNRLAISSHRI